MTRQIGPTYQLLPLEDRVRHLEGEVAALRLALRLLINELAATGKGEPIAISDVARRVRDGMDA